ncbi:MAG: hypothetical protein LBG67_02185 [Campylobacteraceae bacterium]|nr:hypothetical protein [Campylobacteraceae bacterium]
MRKIAKVLFLLAVVSTVMFAAEGGAEFSGVEGVVSSFDTSAQKVVGTLVRWVFGFLPLILFCVGVFGAIKYSKKQAEHDQDSTKVFIWAAGAGILGAIVGILVDALIGVALMGDSQKGLDVLKNFWSDMLGVK